MADGADGIVCSSLRVSANSMSLALACIPFLVPAMDIAENPSREIAQTHQESLCNPLARSPYAKGLRQFTDSTGKWASKTFCRKLGKYRPYNAAWSMECGIIYQEWLMNRTKKKFPLADYCTNRKIAEQRYNGGGWILKEIRKADSLDMVEVRKQCTRAKWACKENYEYPVRISNRQTHYAFIGGELCS